MTAPRDRSHRAHVKDVLSARDHATRRAQGSVPLKVVRQAADRDTMAPEYQYGDIANGHVLTPQGWLPIAHPPLLPRPVRAPLSVRAVFGRLGLALGILIAVMWIVIATGDAKAARDRDACQTWNTQWAQAAQSDNSSKELFFPLFDRQPAECEVTQETFVYGLWHTWWLLDH